MKKDIFFKTILLLILALFLVEYLNPIAIGVRADIRPAPTELPAQGDESPSDSEAPSTTVHFMINPEACRIVENFLSTVLVSSVSSVTEQTDQKEIFHPPALFL